MLFNSYAFLLVFLPAAIVIYRLTDPYPGMRTWTLIALSLVFYSYWNPWFVTVLLGSIFLNWMAAQAYQRTKKRLIITLTIVVDLAVLGFFKYSNFAADMLQALLGIPIRHLNLALPLGISFFTFHHIMYLVDLRRGKAPAFPLDRYALYICFFPQAIAGPIARWWQVMHQFGREVFSPGWERRCAMGVILAMIGFIEKSFADQLSSFLSPIFAQSMNGPVIDGSAWFTPAFAFLVFFDFSGYSDIAIGLGLIFGIELPQNFNAPFRATSIQDFWQRWHMTLSFFLRDYVFTPLFDLRLNLRRHGMPQYFAAILVTMALCGLWHGAGWNFIAWGALHGCAIIFAAAWRRYSVPPPLLLSWLMTFGFLLSSSILFGAGSLTAAAHIYQSFGHFPGVAQLGKAWIIAVALIAAIALPSSETLCLQLEKQPKPWIAAVLAVIGIIILVGLGQDENYDFVYFQF